MQKIPNWAEELCLLLKLKQNLTKTHFWLASLYKITFPVIKKCFLHRSQKSKGNIIFLAMKLNILLLLFAITQVEAKGIAQNITLEGKNMPLEYVISAIKKQTGFGVSYPKDLLKKLKPLTFSGKNVSLRDFLDIIFKEQPIKYRIEERNVFLSIKNRAFQHAPLVDAALNIAESIKVQVKDSLGRPLSGATVFIVNKKKSVAVGKDGYADIALDVSDILSISHIGYKTETVFVSREMVDKKVIDVVLRLNVQINNADNIVIIGYGQVKRKDVTGSVAQVNMEDMQKAPVKSFDDALAGRVAGVQVSGNDGEPGASNNIIIRGTNSVTQDNSPLYVIDGFPLEDGDFNSMNPADIASIDVLKDASATAIYGSRGANGVILITTKRGFKGKPKVSFDAYYGIQRMSNLIQLMSPYEFVKYQLEFNNAKALIDYTPGDLPPGSDHYDPNGKTLESYRNTPPIDWQKLLFRMAPMQNYDIALRGGDDKTKYAISGNILRQEGVVLNTGFGRKQGRITLDQVISRKFKAGVNLNYSSTRSNGAEIGTTASNGSLNLLYGIWAYRPVVGANDANIIDELFDPDIGYNNLSVNPLINAQNAYRSIRNNSLIANSYIEYNIIKNLVLRVSGGITRNTSLAEVFNNSKTTRGNPQNASGVNGSTSNIASNSWLNENILTYNKAFSKKSSLNIVTGVTAQASETTRSSLLASQVPNESLGIDGLDESTNLRATTSSTRWTLASFLGRVTYSYKSKYLLTGSFRADGSSRFAPGKQFAYFPSGAFAWHLSNENFMKGFHFLSDAKIRVSYGVTGNNRIEQFAYLSQLAFDKTVSYSYNNQSPSIGASLSVLGNPELKWESTSQSNIGLDLSLFNDKINLAADVYRKITYDLLLNAQLPFTTGLSQAFKNIGKMRNDGLEITVKTNNLQQEHFSWSSSFNISFNRNELLGLTENQNTLLSSTKFDNTYNSLYSYIAIVGQPVSQMYGLIWDGVYQYSDFDETASGGFILKSNVPTNGSVRSTIKPGDIKYIDINGDGVVDSHDYTIIGRALPLHTGGFSNNFNSYGFDLNVFFQWSYGNDIINANRLIFEGNGKNIENSNQFASYADRWSPANQDAINFRTGGGGIPAFSSRIIEDGSYLRLKTISLGYSFSNKFLDRLSIKSLRVYSSVQNIFTWTKYSGMDPEVSVRNSALTPGFDYAPYPRAKTWTVGVNLTL